MSGAIPGLTKALVAELGRTQNNRNSTVVDLLRKRKIEIEQRVEVLSGELQRDYPEYFELITPRTYTLGSIQKLLSANEALALQFSSPIGLSTIVITHDNFGWGLLLPDRRRTDQVRVIQDWVDTFRQGLDQRACVAANPSSKSDGHSSKDRPTNDCNNFGSLPFDFKLAHKLYKELFGGFEALLRDKTHLIIVPTGPMVALPFNALVYAPPDTRLNGKDRYSKAPWLLKRHAISILPSIQSLATLRKARMASRATHPFIGFGNPLLQGRGPNDKWAKQAWARQDCKYFFETRESRLHESPRQFINTLLLKPFTNYFRGGLSDIRKLLRVAPLPETADEVCALAQLYKVEEDSVFLGSRATERMVKKMSANGKLGRTRVIHFATHGLLAEETERVSDTLSEPALILTPPANKASEEDDGLLTLSEISQLDLDADFVILSACNTAAGEGKNTESLSGIANAFFYAGARSLLVSHWHVDSNATVELITQTSKELLAKPRAGRATAAQQAMLKLIRSSGKYSHPAYWAPFMVVGESGASRTR